MIERGTRTFWQATLALALGSFTVFFNLYAPQPLLPLLTSEFGVSPLIAGMALSVGTLSLATALPLFGPLSDALGRTRIMVFSLAVATACTAALTQVESFTALLVLRGLQGFALGGLPAVAIAYLGDEMRRHALTVAVGIYIAGNSLGGVAGRLVSGAVADQWGWATSFAALAVFSTGAVLVFWALLPASRHFQPQPLSAGRSMRALSAHLRNPLLLTAYLVGGLNFFIFVNQLSYMGFRLSAEPYGWSTTAIGALFLTYLAGTLSSLVSGRIQRAFSTPVAMAIGCGVLALGTLVTLGSSVPIIVLGLSVTAFGFFLTHSAASAWVSRNAAHARATASSLYLVFYYLGASLGGFYLDPFWSAGGWPSVVGGSLLVLIVTTGLSLSLAGRVAIAAAHQGDAEQSTT